MLRLTKTEGLTPRIGSIQAQLEILKGLSKTKGIPTQNFQVFKKEAKTEMNERDYKIAKKLKERLAAIVSLVDFRVFGSRAKGEQDEYSDMDVFIELETLDKEIEDRIFSIAWEVGFEHSIFISPLLFTRYEIENSPLRVSPIVKNIEEEGVRV